MGLRRCCADVKMRAPPFTSGSERDVSYSVNWFKGVYIGDYIGDDSNGH